MRNLGSLTANILSVSHSSAYFGTISGCINSFQVLLRLVFHARRNSAVFCYIICVFQSHKHGIYNSVEN